MNIIQAPNVNQSEADGGKNAAKSQAKPLRFVTNYGAPHPKRRRIGAACMTCRKRKTACSGERPKCETCKQNKLDCQGYSAESAAASTSRTSSNPPSQQDAETSRSGKPGEKGQRAKQADVKTQRLSDTSTAAASSKTGPSPRSDQPRAGTATPTQEADIMPDFLFSGPRNRMPYFRWLGPTAIMPGFKQMVVKIKRQDTDLGKSSTDTAPGNTLSPSMNNIAAGKDPRVPAIYGATPTAIESDVRTPLNLPFYDNSPMPPSELITHLAETFFTHLGCNYPFLPRDRFMRDLEEKQVDAILVDAVCALAARFSSHDMLTQQRYGDDTKVSPADFGNAFAQRAKTALMDTFAVPSVAAVQAALLLAYNEFGESRDSGLWVYLGIAIRLAQDLGMQKVEGLRFRGMEGPTPKQVKRASFEQGSCAMTPETSQPNGSSIDPSLEETTSDEQKAVEQERVDTFWAIFFLDRVVSSGTGRRSTLRDKDIELSFPSLDETLPHSDWHAPFPALIRIVHLYGRVADLLNTIKEPADITPETIKRMASMESQVTTFYQGLSRKLHFDAVNFQYYMKAGEGTNFVLLHFWFHMLIVLLHQPTLLKTFEGRMLQLFPNSQQLSMSSAKTIADILSYSQLMDAKASLGNPFTTQPIYIAACAFLKETAEQTATSNAQSRAPSPSRRSADDHSSDGIPSSRGPPKETKKPAHGSSSNMANASDKRTLAKHSLLATAASQHYQLCYKALQSLETYWAGTKYILTVLDQKFEGVGDPLLYTAEECESSMEEPKPDPAFTTPGWRRKLSWGPYLGNPGLGREFLQGSGVSEGADMSKAIGWTLTGIMNSPSTHLAWHYASDQPNRADAHLPDYNTAANHLSPQEASTPHHTRHHNRQHSSASQPAEPSTQPHQPSYPTANNSSAVSDASLLLGLHTPYPPSASAAGSSPGTILTYAPAASNPTNTSNFTPSYPPPGHGHSNIGPYPAAQNFGDMMIESHDVDMSLLGLDMMPWFDAPYGTGVGGM